MSTATALLPVVRMCDNPDCGGWGACDRIRENPIMGLAEFADPATASDADVLAILRQDIALAVPRCHSGGHQMVPAGCEFTVHKGRIAIADTDLLPEHQGKERYAAVYSGPDVTLDEILASAPESTTELMQERLRALSAEREAAA